jgi:hypothetical protein
MAQRRDPLPGKKGPDHQAKFPGGYSDARTLDFLRKRYAGLRHRTRTYRQRGPQDAERNRASTSKRSAENRSRSVLKKSFPV